MKCIDFVKFIVQEQERQQKNLALGEMMIMRYLSDAKRIKLSEAQEFIQASVEETRKCCNNLIRMGLIEISAKDYMLTARVYDAIKSDVEYTQDRVVRYIKAKDRILDSGKV